MERQASCSCGRLQVLCTGDPVRISICHCLACQRRTGSIFGAQARYARSQVRLVGRAQTYERIGDSGGRVTFHFCPTCGTTVYWDLQALPDHIVVAVGAFADPNFPAPTVSVYGVRRHPWARMPDLHAEQLD